MYEGKFPAKNILLIRKDVLTITNNINKLTKAQLINLLKETEAQLYTCKADSLILSDQLSELQKQYNSLRQHATKQNTEIQQLKAQQTQQAYTLIINNAYQYDFPNKEACHSWMKEKLHSYKLLHTITTPTSVVAFILAVSKAKAKVTK